MTIRETTESFERQMLSKHATLSANTKGRRTPLEPCDLRTEFQRDRDRILHSKAFRRLKHKTQVFITPEGDHYRTRLTHTLEVSQIARTVARGLRLNEDLVEAIALGHDLGHTPFGHAGERALRRCSPDGFEHNEQSLRVADVLENLNLTHEVRDGISNHCGAHEAETPEGRVVKFADRIAYINHDIDDAMRGGILNESSIPSHVSTVLGATHGARIDTLVRDLIVTSLARDTIEMSPAVADAMAHLRQFMFDHVYVGSAAKLEEEKVDGIIEGLYRHFAAHPAQMPNHMVEIVMEQGIDRAVCDYIAGMSDRFALYCYEDVFIPKSWDRR